MTAPVISFVGSTSSSGVQTGATSRTLGAIGGIRSGDVIIAATTTLAGAVSLTAPDAGWTRIRRDDGNSSSMRCEIWYKIATSSADGGGTWSASSLEIAIIDICAYRTTGGPWVLGSSGANVTTTNATGGANVNIVAPSVTADSNPGQLLFCSFAASGQPGTNNAAGTLTLPGSITQRLNNGSTSEIEGVGDDFTVAASVASGARTANLVTTTFSSVSYEVGQSVMFSTEAVTVKLIDIDGFSHKVAEAAQAASGFIGTYDTISNAAGISFDTTNKRLTRHIASLKIVENGVSITRVRRTIEGNNRLLIVSFYFRMTANPTVQSELFSFTGPGNRPLFTVTTSGNIRANVEGGTSVTTSGSYTDSLWHRIDARANTSTSTYTFDWTVDGVAQTQVTRTGQTAVDMTGWQFGSSTGTDTLTAWYGDGVLSNVSTDYPIGPHAVFPIYPIGSGTQTLGTTNPIIPDSGSLALYTYIDDWFGGVPDTTSYISYTSTTTGDAASNFAEFTLGGINQYREIWGVIGYIAGFASGTNANTADTQVLTAHGGTLIDHIGNLLDYSGSTTALGYFRKVLTRISGGWTATNLSNCVIQWGRSTDTNPLPRLSAVMLEFAVPEQAQVVQTIAL